MSKEALGGEEPRTAGELIYAEVEVLPGEWRRLGARSSLREAFERCHHLPGSPGARGPEVVRAAT